MKTRSQWALIVTCLSGLSLFAAPIDKTPLSATAGKPAGVYFTENKGQVHDQNNVLRPDVLFSGSTGEMVFHLRQTGVSYQLSQGEASAEVSEKGQSSLLKDTERQTICRVDMNWVNADPKANIKTEYIRPGVEHYYQSAPYAGVTGVRSFGQVTYESLYPGISLKWYEKDGHLKYDYLVAAGADYSQVQLLVEGAESLRINGKGEVEIKTALGMITEHAPQVTQNEKILPSRWVLKGKVLSFAIDGVSSDLPLIIDPAVYAWITYYGGTNGEDTHSCKTDNLGNVYFAGETRSTTAIATSGAYQTSLNGGTDAFLAKFTAGGVRLWATYYGVSGGSEIAYACDVDAGNNVYMAGRNQSGAVLFKFNSSGFYQWSVTYGSSSYDIGRACAVDAGGNVYFTGETTATSGIATPGSHQATIGSTSQPDAFLAKFDTNGNLLWGTYYGGTNEDMGYGCDTDPSGNVYLAGTTRSTSGISTSGSHQSAIGSTSGGLKDGFLVKFNSSGVRQWGTYYGSTGDDYAYACATDLYGNIFMSGAATSGSGIATAGSYQPNKSGTMDAYVVKFTPAGTRLWGTYYGGTDFTYGYACATDGSGSVYMVGSIVVGTANMQAYVYKFLSSGTYQWGNLFGNSPGDERFQAVTADATGAVYVAGLTSTGLPVQATAGSHQQAYGGGYDAIFVKLQDCNAVSTTPLSDLVVCNGNSTVLSAASATNTITWYATSTSTAVLGTGTTYTTPALSAGTYTYYASSDACMPNQRTAITVTAQVGPAVTAAGGSICPGQSFTIVPSGAVSYSYSSGSPVVSPMTTTVYIVTGESSAGCTGTATVQVTVNALPSVSATSSTVCSGATATLTASGASTYTWSTGATGANVSVAPSSTTQYTVSGTSSSGCVNTATASVVVTPGPVITVAGATVCAGTAAVLTASGVSSYTWNTGATTASVSVSPSSTTTYTVSGNDPGCPGSVSQTVMVTVNALPTIGISGTATLCSGQSTVLGATGTANSYTWNTGQTTTSLTVSPAANTSYTVTGTDANGCANTASTMVTVNALPSVAAASSAICGGSTATVTATGASTYTWNTGATGANLYVSPASTTNYTVTGTSTAGCVNTATASITVNAAPVITVNAATVCAGASATLMASGVSSYTWNTGANGSSLVVSPASTTTYTVSGRLAGCSTTAVGTTTVTVNALPVLNVSAVSNSICAGQSTTLSLTGTAASYTWSTGQSLSAITVSPIASTNYSITGTHANGCSNTASVNITVNSNPVLSVPAASVCLGGTVTLNASGASTYTWNTGAVGASLSVSPLTMTQYTVSGTSASGCIGNTTVTVSVGPGPAVAVNHATICAGASALLTASGAASYTWSTGQQTPAVSVSPLSTSVYTITGELPGCNYQSVQTATVTVNMTPTVSITSSGTLICVGQTPTLTAFGATSYTWSTTQVANPIVINPATTSNYTVTGASLQGCQGVAVITISVSPCTGLAENNGRELSLEVYPNPFTGVFTIRYANQNGEEVTVLNALGAIVYQVRLSEERTEIALPYEAGGIYFVQIKTAQGVVTKKIVKE